MASHKIKQIIKLKNIKVKNPNKCHCCRVVTKVAVGNMCGQV